MLPYDPKKNATYSAMDEHIGMIERGLSDSANGKLTWDKTGPHTDLLGEIPYLGSPHREKSD